MFRTFSLHRNVRLNLRGDQRATLGLVAAGALLACNLAAAQSVTQKVTGPQARYWLSAETASGMPGLGGQAAGGQASGGAGGGFGAMLGALSGMGGEARRTLLLELGAVREAADPAGNHAIPGGMAMGPSLPLLAPERTANVRTPQERDLPEQRERPEGNARMLFFWGCGDNVGADQPVVLDIRQTMEGKVPPNMQSYAINAGPTGPQFGRDRSYLSWPNRKDSQAVPATASLVGEHLVQANVAPDIRYAVAASHDFMEGLNLANEKNAAGALLLRWNSLPTATGYFATAMGFKPTGDKSTDMVFWNSSAKKLLGGERLLGFVAPPEVARLQRDNVVMPASQTECAIPRQVVEAAGGNMGLLNLNGFGPELNVVHPPRPQDPRQDWNQEYAVKLRLRSFTSSIAGMPAMGAPTRPAAATTRPAAPAPSAPPAGAQVDAPATNPNSAPNAVPGVPDIGNAVEGGVKLLKGLFGR